MSVHVRRNKLGDLSVSAVALCTPGVHKLDMGSDVHDVPNTPHHLFTAGLFL